jgi:hypothetical protein
MIARHANGLISVDQCMINGFRITYNPDDNRFWVDGLDENDEPINYATFQANEKGLQNARYYATKHNARAVK